MRFARAHRSIELFNEQVKAKAIVRSGDEHLIDKESLAKLTGVIVCYQTKRETTVFKPKKKKKKAQKAIKENQKPEEADSGESDIDTSPKIVEKKAFKKQVMVDPLYFFDHLNTWKYDFNLDFLPLTRKEYHDPTDKSKSSYPKVEATFSKGHNIWYFGLNKAGKTKRVLSRKGNRDIH